jgi:helix-turn-helix protein
VSFHCSNMVWERDFGTPFRKVIAARLADRADSNGCGIWPSVERIAAECCLSVRTVQRVLRDFVKEGLLIVVDEGGKGPGNPRHYDFDLTVLTKLPLVKWGKKARETPVKNNQKNKPLKGDNQSPIDPAKGVSVSNKGDCVTSKGCLPVAQTLKELSDKPPKGGRSRARAKMAVKQVFHRTKIHLPLPSFKANSKHVKTASAKP